MIEGNCIQGGRLLLDYHISIELQSLLYQTVKIRVIVNMSVECIACQNPIRARQQGLRFDSCFRRQHRTCGTGIPVWLPFCWANWCFHRLALCYLSVHVAVWEYACRWEYACWLLTPMSTLYEPLADPAVDESSILEPLPAAVENDSSFTVTFQILEDSTTKGRPKLIDSRD